MGGKNKPPAGYLRESIVPNPVAHCHEIVKHNPGLPRAALVHMLHNQGVAWWTARTQVQIALHQRNKNAVVQPRTFA